MLQLGESEGGSSDSRDEAARPREERRVSQDFQNKSDQEIDGKHYRKVTELLCYSKWIIISQVGETRIWAEVLLLLPAMIFWCDIGKVVVPPATSQTASFAQTIHTHQDSSNSNWLYCSFFHTQVPKPKIHEHAATLSPGATPRRPLPVQGAMAHRRLGNAGYLLALNIRVDRKRLFWKVQGVNVSKVALWYQNTVYET